MPKILSTQEMTDLNAKAVRAHSNRTLSQEFITALDPDGVHVVVTSMLVDDQGTIRAHVMSKLRAHDDPVIAILDIYVGDFNRLKQVGEHP